MKITESNPLRSAAPLRKKAGAASASSSNFMDVLSSIESSSSTSASVGISDVAAASGLDPLLSLQEVSEEEYGRQKAIQHGHTLLDSLEALRHSLLMGMVPVDVLRTLETRLTQQRATVTDPALLSLMDDIELRAAVELAKWEQSRK